MEGHRLLRTCLLTVGRDSGSWKAASLPCECEDFSLAVLHVAHAISKYTGPAHSCLLFKSGLWNDVSHLPLSLTSHPEVAKLCAGR